MKTEILAQIAKTLSTLGYSTESLMLSAPKQPEHGDYATNVAFLLGKQEGKSPRVVAQTLVEAWGAHEWFETVEAAGPGFINFTLSVKAWSALLGDIALQGSQYGCRDVGKGERILLEYVSVNPTGPMHVGHGRAAAMGSALASVLKSCGFEVHSEYYVNDAGRQMHILTLSLWIRYLQQAGFDIALPEGAYQGEYVNALAALLHQEQGLAYVHGFEAAPIAEHEDPEAYLDAWMSHAKLLLGDAYSVLYDRVLSAMLEDIQNDLGEFGTHFDHWQSERALTSQGEIQSAIDALHQKGLVYEKEGAQWFASTTFGDDKDRVLVRENGTPTYFAADVAYHWHKLQRGYDHYIDMFGADHHGYVARLRAACAGLGFQEDQLEVYLVQFANLYRGNEKVSMSTRAGEFVTFRELREEVGNEATRLFYLMRKSDQHMDFDLELAKSQTQENPIYYIQYAHARLSSVLAQAMQQAIPIPSEKEIELSLLLPNAREVLQKLAKYPDVLQEAAQSRGVHIVVHWLMDMAASVHRLYNQEKFISDDNHRTQAFLVLVRSAKQVLANGLMVLGIAPLDRMERHETSEA